MTIKIEKIYDNDITVDNFYPLSYPITMVIDNTLYLVDKNLVYRYDTKTTELRRLPDFNKEYNSLCILKSDNGILILTDLGDLYNIVDDTWELFKTVGLIGVKKSVITQSSQYVISSGAIYEFKENDVSLFIESDIIDPSEYIPSFDKGVVYFKEGKIDLSSKSVHVEKYDYDYITFGEGSYLKKNLVIDKKESLILYYENNTFEIKYKRLSDDDWKSISLTNKRKAIIEVGDILFHGSNMFIVEVNGISHNLYKYELRSHKLDFMYGLVRKNKSYSRNIQYNHPSPMCIKYKNEASIVGKGGYYFDNSVFDNSIYLKDKVIPLSLGIESPIYFSNKDLIHIADIEKNLIYTYTINGEHYKTEEVQFKEGTISFKYYDGLVSVTRSNSSYLYDIKNKEILGEVGYSNSTTSCSDKSFHYCIIENDSGDIYLRKTSFSLKTDKLYPIQLNDTAVNNINGMKLYADEGAIYIYIEENFTKWIVYRIIINE